MSDAITYEELGQLLVNGLMLVHSCIGPEEDAIAYRLIDATGEVWASGPTVKDVLGAWRKQQQAEAFWNKALSDGPLQIGHTAVEIMKMPPESREHAYRRGYRDGWIMALEGIWDAMVAGHSRSDAYDLVAAHDNGPLFDWVCRGDKDDASSTEWPPHLVIPKRKARASRKEG